MEQLKHLSKTEISTVVKYAISVIITLLTIKNAPPFLMTVGSLMELLFIFLLTNSLGAYFPSLSYVLNNLLITLYNVEQILFLFGGSYLSLIMLSNVDSISALSGRLTLYLLSIVVVILFSLLPIRRITIVKKPYEWGLLGLVLSLNLALLSSNLIEATPLSNYGNVFFQRLEQLEIKQTIQDRGETKTQLYKEDISNAITKPSNLVTNPNIIIIFTEGLSQHIIDDERHIMPNIADLQEKSLNVVNFYNHTFATYRGLIGQLFSGYQFDNYDSNSLVSIQDILHHIGYETSFINVEPNNQTFTTYLENLRFDNLVTKRKNLKGIDDTLSDREAYQLLLKEMDSQYRKKTPFFMALYTFGTHVSLDSVDITYQDGSDPTLNKFHDLDYQFGEFLEAFHQRDFADNTIIVFTTDHATYVDDSYLYSFPDYKRHFGSFDKVPFFIYYKGITPQTIDAKGRNSLDLVPTVLDYVDVSYPNYFIGTSLFREKPDSKMSYVFNSELNILTSFDATIEKPDNEDYEAYLAILKDYFSASQ